ncbi:phytoene desaturase family protein [Aquimonas voraii]|uniref:Pyridine nucleotide-disulfide oxidoreductase domain-containing protein 2 n=1 Tax=Aquimonas voraii TaxID=265719 RepID=A0A1G6UB44_9GAMM|nr:NAD(P)/FAD-dependent oxidoreductase [Aquimonas voraii]SDD37795.1 Phytoene dehydrogenase-related protein [Aquimonas voraii]
MSDTRSDVLVIGAGHNGLVCATYLAKAGLSVRVLERRGVVGGAAVTEEFHPGFRNSTASYTVSLLHPKVIRELDLHGHGLRIVERELGNFLPLPDGRYLKAGEGRTQAEVAKFSARDAERLPAYGEHLDRIAGLLRELAAQTPPNVPAQGGWLAALPELIRAAGLGRRAAALGIEGQRDLLDLFTDSAGAYLERWFESEPIQALFGFDGVVGNYASPYAAGSAYVLLHHVFGEVNGKAGVWGHAIGGMGAITQAMARSAQAAGVQIEVNAGVTEVLVEQGRAVGVRCSDGRVHRAGRVVANVNPKLLFTQLVPPSELPADFAERMRGYRCGSGTFRMNVALSELPDFNCLPGRARAEHHTAGIILAPSLRYMEQAFFDARQYGWSQQPIVEMLIPSTLDDSLAPEGAHVASLFCQHVAPELPDGKQWPDHRDEVARMMIDTVNAHAPNFKASVLGYRALSPFDLEQEFGLIGGDIFHGALSLNQLFSARPVLGHGNYRMPLKGLYLCGSGAHPGGGVSGLPGHNAAREVLRDRR